MFLNQQFDSFQTFPFPVPAVAKVYFIHLYQDNSHSTDRVKDACKWSFERKKY